jgi:hypothetical protein
MPPVLVVVSTLVLIEHEVVGVRIEMATVVARRPRCIAGGARDVVAAVAESRSGPREQKDFVKTQQVLEQPTRRSIETGSGGARPLRSQAHQGGGKATQEPAGLAGFRCTFVAQKEKAR